MLGCRDDISSTGFSRSGSKEEGASGSLPFALNCLSLKRFPEAMEFQPLEIQRTREEKRPASGRRGADEQSPGVLISPVLRMWSSSSYITAALARAGWWAVRLSRALRRVWWRPGMVLSRPPSLYPARHCPQAGLYTVGCSGPHSSG